MGERGPVPKRSDQRRRRNVPEGPGMVTVQASDQVSVPEADPMWHPIAKEWFESLRTSAQRVFYEPSDWATARYLAEAMSRNLADRRFSAQLFASVMSAMTELLVTEGARRRARIEIEREVKPAEAPSVAIMDRYRQAAQ